MTGNIVLILLVLDVTAIGVCLAAVVAGQRRRQWAREEARLAAERPLMQMPDGLVLKPAPRRTDRVRSEASPGSPARRGVQ